MILDGHEVAFLRGLRLLASRSWFEAHEALEGVWRAELGPRRREFLQGLIQAAVALEHLRRGRSDAAKRLLHRARTRLGPLGAAHEGVAVGPWLVAIARLLDGPGQPPEGEWPVPGLAPDVAARVAALEA